MATTITRVTALSALITFAEANGCPDTDAIARVTQLRDQLAKPKAKTSGPSKAHLQNAALCGEVLDALARIAPATAGQLVDALGSPLVTTPQKATVLLGMLASEGRVTREVVKGRALWSIAD